MRVLTSWSYWGWAQWTMLLPLGSIRFVSIGSFIAHRNIHWFLADFWHLSNGKAQALHPETQADVTKFLDFLDMRIASNKRMQTGKAPWAEVHPQLQRGSLWGLPHWQRHPWSHGSWWPHHWEVCGLGGGAGGVLAWVENILVEEKK